MTANGSLTVRSVEVLGIKCFEVQFPKDNLSLIGDLNVQWWTLNGQRLVKKTSDLPRTAPQMKKYLQGQIAQLKRQFLVEITPAGMIPDFSTLENEAKYVLHYEWGEVREGDSGFVHIFCRSGAEAALVKKALSNFQLVDLPSYKGRPRWAISRLGKKASREAVFADRGLMEDIKNRLLNVC